jgi:hypothetical protein
MAMTRLSPSINGTNTTDDSFAYYAPQNKKIYLCGDMGTPAGGVNYGQIWQIDPTTGAQVFISNNGGQWYQTEACEFEGGGKIFQYMRYNGVSSVIDLVAGTVTNTPPLSDLFHTDALVALFHSNKNGLLALRASGTLATIDPATGIVSNIGPSGIPAALLAISVVNNGTWNRCKLVTIGAAQKFVFPIETSANVYEMVL